jgi:hypothetical protein
MGKPDWKKRQLPVAYSKSQVAACPPADMVQLASTQWDVPNGAEAIGLPPYEDAGRGEFLSGISFEKDETHLRSARELLDYRIQGSDGTIGYVDDLIVDHLSWSIRYLVDISFGLAENKMLISPAWVREIVFAEQRVYVGFSREMIRTETRFNPSVRTGSRHVRDVELTEIGVG